MTILHSLNRRCRALGGRLNRSAAERLGFLVVRARGPVVPRRPPLPAGAAAHLRPDHPRLLELAARTARFEPRVSLPFIWNERSLRAEDLRYFRGDNAFLWQARGENKTEAGHVLTYWYTKQSPAGRLLDVVTEDDAFGAHTFTIDGRTVTRDLLDSVREIEFLQRHVLGANDGRAERNVLDIGAGYGRLAHRLHEASESVRTFATDAVACSTFIAEYYLRHRGATRATVVPIDELDALLRTTKIDVATNVHSFSECTADAVAWWVERLARHAVRYVMIVPNECTSRGERCGLHEGGDMEPILARFGYRLATKEPRYRDPLVQKHGIDPVWLHLFELR